MLGTFHLVSGHTGYTGLFWNLQKRDQRDLKSAGIQLRISKANI
jgi:hypothetical protein